MAVRGFSIFACLAIYACSLVYSSYVLATAMKTVCKPSLPLASVKTHQMDVLCNRRRRQL